jgi:hypothetical protein
MVAQKIINRILGDKGKNKESYHFFGKHGSWDEDLDSDTDASLRANALNVGFKKQNKGGK